MTSPFATNSVAIGQSKPFTIAADKEGVPLNKQIPITQQVYTGTGGVSIVPDGSEVIFVNSTLAAGSLLIDCTSQINFNNMIGRRVTLVVPGTQTNSVIFSVAGNGKQFISAGGVGNTATVAANQRAVATLHFLSPTLCAIVPGANVTLTTV